MSAEIKLKPSTEALKLSVDEIGYLVIEECGDFDAHATSNIRNVEGEETKILPINPLTENRFRC